MITDLSAALARMLRLQCHVLLPEATKNLPEIAMNLFAEKGLIPIFINTTSDDSLLIEYFENDAKYLVEFFSDGDIVLLCKAEKVIDAWDLQPETFADKLRFVLRHLPKQVTTAY